MKNVARCPDCTRLLPIYDIEVREGHRKRFGLHDDRQGHRCPKSDALIDPDVARYEQHLQGAFDAAAENRDCCCDDTANPFCSVHEAP